MPDVHSLGAMIDRIRALLTVIEEGSVNRAAVRLRITQPALSRQMQALENEIGGKLLERETSGVKPTGLGHALVKSMRPLVESYDAALAELRRQARGERSELRVGYLISAAQSVLTPALARLRKISSRSETQAARPLAARADRRTARRRAGCRAHRPGRRGGGARVLQRQARLARRVRGRRGRR